MRLLPAIAALACSASWVGAEIVDRIAVTAGDRFITDSDIRQMLRISAFLNSEAPSFSAAERRKAAERLVDQALLRREMEMSRFPVPTAEEVLSMLESVKAGRFSTDAEYRAALATAGVTEAELKQRLQWQTRLLRFIDFRFTPGIQLSRTELETYYKNEYLPRWRAKTAEAPPSMEETRTEIERDVNSRKGDEALEQWLAAARTQAAIVYHPEAFE